jgi:hypothetical protein
MDSRLSERIVPVRTVPGSSQNQDSAITFGGAASGPVLTNLDRVIWIVLRRMAGPLDVRSADTVVGWQRERYLAVAASPRQSLARPDWCSMQLMMEKEAKIPSRGASVSR